MFHYKKIITGREMSKIINIVLIALLVFCNRPQSLNEEDIKTEVNNVLQTCVEGWNEGNIDKYMSVYLESDSLRFAGNNSYKFGWQTVTDGYKQRYNTPAKMGKLIFSEIKITIISKEAALVFGRYTLKRETDEPTGLFTLLFKKLDGEWKIVSDHTSS